MASVDRFADGYEPNFDIDAAVGHQGEMFWRDVQKCLADGSAEVKTDEKALVTRNIYLEYECLKQGKWQPSGIASNSEVWVHVIGTIAVAVPMWQIREAARRAYRAGRKKEMLRGSHPTRGVLIPLNELLSLLIEAGVA